MSLLQLRFEAHAIRQAGHGVKRLCNDVLGLANDLRHETLFPGREFALFDAPQLGQHSFDVALRIDNRTDHRLETLAGNDRKTSGSYYTPTALIDLVLDLIDEYGMGKPFKDDELFDVIASMVGP